MKKIWTLLFAVFTVSAVVAQSAATDKAKSIIRGDRPDYDPARNTTDEAKSVIRDRNRNREIVYDDRNIRRNDGRRYNERSGANERRKQDGKNGKSYQHNGKAYKHKNNKGKHLGWHKGVGNPHRNRKG